MIKILLGIEIAIVHFKGLIQLTNVNDKMFLKISIRLQSRISSIKRFTMVNVVS